MKRMLIPDCDIAVACPRSDSAASFEWVDLVCGENMSAHKSWMDTNLWRFIQERDSGSHEYLTYLKSSLDDVESLSTHASTSPLDFTLHDNLHSYRVAQRMTEILSKATIDKMSTCELALLLSSAYLHDIGMNPKRSVVGEIKEFLFDPKRSQLSEGEQDNIQTWLDSSEPGAQPPILEKGTHQEREIKISQLTTYYCRHRHNDWSGDYIRDNISKHGSTPYPNWISDLTLLCKSHHYGLARLEKDEFDLRLVGSDKGIVNLRFLAAILRVADVMEIDPERTPQVVLSHRDIGEKSLVYWYKDQDMAVRVVDERTSVLISARTKNAWVHKAVLETIDGIDRELSLCADMHRSGKFIAGVQVENLSYYVWTLPAKVIRDVKPTSGTFEYIDGAFRPDSQRIIQLLAGTALYGDSFAALRELVQNAADAVREQIAHETVLASEGVHPAGLNARGQLHSVKVDLLMEAGSLIIRCTDSGTGMSKEIIENYLLVSGSKPRPSLLNLQRQCSARSVDFQRSGEFGIGVLSYFMLADRISIMTKPSEEMSTVDRQAWKFELDGVGSFGELRPIAKRTRGTEISLYLKQEFSSEEHRTLIFDSIRRLVTKVPCNFQITSSNLDFTCPPGWVSTIKDLKSLHFNAKRNRVSNRETPLTSILKKSLDLQKEPLEKRIAELSEATIQFDGPYHFPIGDIGEIRIHVPFFEIDGDVTLHFFESRNADIIPDPDNNLFQPRPSRYLRSWRGFSITPKRDSARYEYDRYNQRSYSLFCEVDLVKGGQIAVDRTSIEMDDRRLLHETITNSIDSALSTFFSKNPSSIYSVLDADWTLWRSDENLRPIYRWIFEDRSEKTITRVFRDISFPAIAEIVERVQGQYTISQNRRERHNIVNILFLYGRSGQTIQPLYNVQPTKLMLSETPYLAPFLLYEKGASWICTSRVSVEMPPEWDNMLCVGPARKIFNKNHVLFKAVSDADFDTYADHYARLKIEDFVLDASRNDVISACFIQVFIHRNQEFWMSIQDNFPSEWELIHSRLQLNGKPIICWHGFTALDCISIERKTTNYHRLGFHRYEKSWIELKRPSDNWII